MPPLLPWIAPLWAQQAAATSLPGWLRAPLLWLVVLGEPGITDQTFGAFVGSLITWLKVVGLFCLLGWTLSWVVSSLKERRHYRIDRFDIAALAALGVTAGALLLDWAQTLQRTRTIRLIGGMKLSTGLALIGGVVVLAWVERALWSSIGRIGTRADKLVLAGIHAAIALGLAVATGMAVMGFTGPQIQIAAIVNNGARLGATYMGFVVLFRVLILVAGEVGAIRWRRIYSIAWLTVIESVRKMWAPWVVLTVFGVVLAFTHWFLQPPRPAELGRLYVGTLALVCSLLLTLMATLLTPLSLPADIQMQTIYTVVSKPVRRLEMIWGRVLGFMALTTVVLAIFGGVSLFYLWRMVQVGAIQRTEAAAVKARDSGLEIQAKQLEDEAKQLRGRMSARVPIKGSLTFVDSKGTEQYKGIDVGQELEYRSHVEGATQAAAIWKYGIVEDPYEVFQAKYQQAQGTPAALIGPPRLLDRRIPVAQLLPSDSIEGIEDRVYRLRYEEQRSEQIARTPDAPQAEKSRLAANLPGIREDIKRLEGELKQLNDQSAALEAKAAEADKAGQASEAAQLRSQAAGLHAPPIVIEMSFNIYRTTKGIVGEPVFASLKATNPRTQTRYTDTFPVREYYTNTLTLPASLLAGSMGDLRIEIQCISATQYLGMAESDLYLLADNGDFGWNYIKGLLGVWLQTLVLTAVGVFAGTFLRWPVALVTTLAFFVAGQLGFTVLQMAALDHVIGGGPFEQFIRMVTQNNQMSDLTPTLGFLIARTLDSIIMPVLSRLVYIVPNFQALDFSNTVADGFAVRLAELGAGFGLAVAYALPFTIAAYFILKNREVAA